jgi:hypothetical protein
LGREGYLLTDFICVGVSDFTGVVGHLEVSVRELPNKAFSQEVKT